MLQGDGLKHPDNDGMVEAIAEESLTGNPGPDGKCAGDSNRPVHIL